MRKCSFSRTWYCIEKYMDDRIWRAVRWISSEPLGMKSNRADATAMLYAAYENRFWTTVPGLPLLSQRSYSPGTSTKLHVHVSLHVQCCDVDGFTTGTERILSHTRRNLFRNRTSLRVVLRRKRISWNQQWFSDANHTEK